MKGLLRIAFLSIAVLLVQGTWALAGTTGSLNGTVLNEKTNAPVSNAKVTASSASQTSSTNTDNGGHFTFVSLVPDTYTVTVTEENVIEPFVQGGVTILADQLRTLSIIARPAIKTLATVTTRAGGTNLVQPGTTANVYSVDTRAQARTAALGGGGGSDQGYSALAALPGAYIAPGQAGWYQTVNIRGGDYDQVGYEFDGIPVNRSFDNYPTTNLSAIGQQELQIYTGAAPASAEGQGLAGYINQVIKSGTYPGYGSVSLGIGYPALYNKASLELGGGTPNRNLTYYIGIGVITSAARVYDSNNGVSQNSNYGLVYDMTATGSDCAAHNTASETLCYANGANAVLGVPAGPGGYYLGGLNIYTPALLKDRENVFNVHIGLPHHNDSGKDDIQLLYDVFQLYNYYYSSPNDWGGGPSFFSNNIHGAIEGPGSPIFLTGFQSHIPLGTTFSAADPSQASNIVPYAYPSEGSHGFFGDPIPQDQRGTYDNGNGIYKLQYQHNIGTSAYLRAYGYIYYSWWFIHDPMAAWNFDFGLAPDYELWTHTRGGSIQYVNQLSPHHLLNFEGTYSTASTVRDNNTQMFNFTTSREVMANLVSAANPTNGICYSAANPGVQLSCLKGTRNFGGEGSGGGGDYLAFADVAGGGIPAPSATACGGPCVWYVSESGPYGTFNTVTPRFWAASLQDTWKPTDRLNLNIGVRENIYTFVYTPTGGGTRQFWLNAWNQVSCVNPNFNGGNPVDETTLGFPAGTACGSVATAGFPAGSFAPATLFNTTANGGQVTYPEFEPRISGTYTFGPDDVLRFSAGRFSEPANAAFQQYNHLAQDVPDALWGTLFYRFGFNTPNHRVRPSISYNYDLSIEHRFPNTNTSFRLTPFLRQTHDQVQQLYIAPTQAFVSGLNVGNETNIGAEFLLNMGDFNANGVAAQVSYTYTHSYIKYSPLPNGQTVVAFDNVDIAHYNAFTSACVGATPSFSPTAVCGPDGGNLAHQCFLGAVGADGAACTAATTANPYFNAPIRPLLNPNAQYEPYDIVPVGVQLSSIGYVVPHVATLVLQFKHDKWSFIPGIQFHAGQKYGAPETTYGFDPSSCGTPLGGAIAGDPRYPFSGTGGPADAVTCGGNVVMPDPFTGNFDAPGAFTEPSQLTAGVSIQYEASSRISYQANVANIVNTCFGGTKAPWVLNNNKWCLYGGAPGFIAPVGNFFNPGSTIQPYVKYPYFPNATGDNGLGGVATPIQASFNVNIKI